MSCYHPMVLIKTSDMTDKNQRRIVDNLRLRHAHDKKIKSVNTLLVPREIALQEGVKLDGANAILVPCGHCIGCRLDYSRQWAERCIHEASSHEFNYFLSLTYDEDNIPIGSKGIPTLIKDEISAFMKRLRKYLGPDIRYFGCGEYGDLSKRPHYHIILFNCKLDDLQERHPIKVDGKVKWIYQYDDSGEKLLFSPTVYKAWQGRGTAQIGQVTFESCAYVSRYIVKKQLGVTSSQYADCGIIPPYVRMSLKPGIGYSWYKEHFEQIYLYDNYILKRGDKAVPVKPGRYCDRLLQDVDQQRFYDLKEKRHRDFYDRIGSLASSGIDLVRNNEAQEIKTKSSATLLKRN